AEIFVADLVEIVLADIHGKTLPPIIGIAFVGDRAAGHEAFDLVGAGAERRLERSACDVALLAVRVLTGPPVLRQNRELADNLRQLAVARRIESESDFPLAG